MTETISTTNTFHTSFKARFFDYLENFTGHNHQNFTKFNRFVQWMHRPTNAAPLAIFRMLFGILMLIDIPEERGGGHLDVRYGEPKDCHFPLFNSVRPLGLPLMGVLYFMMWLGALGIALGYKFKSSSLLFLVTYWYIFLLDKPTWNNHSYLYGLCGFLLLWTDANKFCSIDYKGLPRAEQTVPYWNYFLIKFQFFILYFIAGLKKLTIEWLSGYSMSNLGYHWVFLPFRMLLSVEMTELLIIHWFAAIFDVSIAFWMTWDKTRLWATPFMISFHLMNSRLFTIGMFPWVCLAEIPLFYNVNWPQIIYRKLFSSKTHQKPDENDAIIVQDDQVINKRIAHKITSKEMKNLTNIMIPNYRQIIRVILILLYCLVQFFLPYSHFITKGYNNWTNGLYGYSWDMMVHSYDTILISVKIMDNNNQKIHYLDPYAFTGYDRWTKHADMAVQYAKCIEKNLILDFERNPRTLLTSKNYSIYFDVWCSMNGRFQQRIFNPNENLLTANWSVFEETPWILPVLNKLNYMRPKLNAITTDVLSWSNHSDVLFIADFPGLTLENFIAPELDNVTLTVLEGAVKLTHSNGLTKSISTGQRVTVKPDAVHHVTTISQSHSCYMYTYINKTMKNMKSPTITTTDKENNWLPIWQELSIRATNYRDFLYHVGNSILFLMYGVPMPVRLRDRN